jgi:hypothetical protein
MNILFSQFCGESLLEILAPIYDEFQRWKTILHQDFQVYLIRNV